MADTIDAGGTTELMGADHAHPDRTAARPVLRHPVLDCRHQRTAAIISDLGGGQSAYSWVVTSSLLAITASTPLWGKLADQFSKKSWFSRPW
jgi:hypothetical protein